MEVIYLGGEMVDIVQFLNFCVSFLKDISIRTLNLNNVLLNLSFIFIIVTYYEINTGKMMNIEFKFFRVMKISFIVAVISILIHLLLGDTLFFISPLLALSSVYLLSINKKVVFFNVYQEEKEDKEVGSMEKLFNDFKNPSILEVLLMYGYISENHKEIVEINNIFLTPDEMVDKLKRMRVLSTAQLNEARAIMNIIRREGRIVTKQEALLLLSEIKNK